MDQNKAEERFLKDITDHKMEIIRDNGIDRHIKFKRPETSAYYFEIITWPGKLMISGDCGTWVLCRTTDMFDFFRMDDRDFNHSPEKKLQVNPGYWAEKLIVA